MNDINYNKYRMSLEMEFEVIEESEDDPSPRTSSSNNTPQSATSASFAISDSVLHQRRHFSDEESSLSHPHEMFVSTSTTPQERDGNSASSEYDAVYNLNSNERNGRLIGRRIDVLIHPTGGSGQAYWERGTILNFDKVRDVHWVLPDGQQLRKEYTLSEVVYRLVETEEEWVMDVDHVESK